VEEMKLLTPEKMTYGVKMMQTKARAKKN